MATTARTVDFFRQVVHFIHLKDGRKISAANTRDPYPIAVLNMSQPEISHLNPFQQTLQTQKTGAHIYQESGLIKRYCNTGNRLDVVGGCLLGSRLEGGGGAIGFWNRESMLFCIGNRTNGSNQPLR